MPDRLIEQSYAASLLKKLGHDHLPCSHEERPDFVIQDGSKMIGLEVSDATPEEYQRAIRALDAAGWKGCIFPTHWQHREGRRPTRELVDEGTSRENSWADCGETLQRWASRLEERLRAKERCFAHPEFRRLEENWLLIADLRHSPITHEPDLVEAKDIIERFVRSYRPAPFFDKIFILMSDAGLITWDHTLHHATWDVNDTLTFEIS